MESYFRGTEVNIENANKKVLISKKKKKGNYATVTVTSVQDNM